MTDTESSGAGTDTRNVTVSGESTTQITVDVSGSTYDDQSVFFVEIYA